MEKMRRAEALARVGVSSQVSLPWALGQSRALEGRLAGRDLVPGVALPSQPSPHLPAAGGRGSPRGQGSTGGCWGERRTATHLTQPRGAAARAAAGAHPEGSGPGGQGMRGGVALSPGGPVTCLCSASGVPASHLGKRGLCRLLREEVMRDRRDTCRGALLQREAGLRRGGGRALPQPGAIRSSLGGSPWPSPQGRERPPRVCPESLTGLPPSA